MDTTFGLIRTLSDKLLIHVLDNLPIGVIISDQNNIIRYNNNSTQEMFDANLVGEPETNWVWDEEQELILHDQLKKRKAGEQSKYKLSWKKSDNSRLYTVVSALPIIEDEQYQGNFGTITDLNEIRSLMQKLQNTEIIRTFAQDFRPILHEVGNALTASMGYADLLIQNEDDPEKKDMLRMVMEGLEKSDYISENVLALSRPTEEKREIFDLGETVNKTLDFIANAGWSKPYKVEKELSEYPLLVCADKKSLQLTLINLCKNGMEAMEDQGFLTVGTRQKDNFAEFYVQDQGCGIPQEKYQSIFKINYTSKENGSGLGLYNVQRYLESNNGYIKIEWSEVGKGTCMVGGLPLVKVSNIPNEILK